MWYFFRNIPNSAGHFYPQIIYNRKAPAPQVVEAHRKPVRKIVQGAHRRRAEPRRRSGAPQNHFTATASISTSAPIGSAATS